MDKPKKIKKSLVASFWDGFFASIQFGIVDQFSTPLALFFGANTFAIGILNFVRNSLVSIVQVKSADVTLRLKSRKRLIMICVFLTAALWIPTFFLPFAFDESVRIWIFIALFSVTSALNLFAGPAWGSLMSQYIPAAKRGAYFGWRGTVLGIIYSISVFLAGLLLNYFNRINLFWGFAILMLTASITRFISWFFLTKMYEPRWKVKETDYFTFWDFIGKWRRSNFARFAIFSSFLTLGVAMASPFFSVYLLRELKISYSAFTIIITAAVVTSLITQRYWGIFADKYGNIKILKLTAFLITLVPLGWLVSSNLYYLFFLQLLAGFVWAGFTISSSNFIYDVATSTKRERCIAYFNFLSGAGLAIGSLIGGTIYGILPPLLGSSFLTLFFLSSVVRLVSAVLIRYFTREVKNVQKAQVREFLFDLSGLRFIGLLSKELLVKGKK